jgi:endonuclease YncB( thermonuclease family)
MGSHIIFMAIVCVSVCAPTEVKVWDGDTVWVAGTKYRLAGFDTPEYSNPKCQAEYDLAVKARERVADLLRQNKFRPDSHGRVELRSSSRGLYIG